MKLFFLSIFFSFTFLNLFAQDSTYLQFDGYSSYIDVPYSPTLRSANKMTLSAWIQPYTTGGDWQALMWCGSYFENHYAFKITPDNRIRGLIWIDGPVTIFSETRVESNTWYHIAFTFDNSIITDNNYKLYINGHLEAQTHIYGSIGQDANPMIMGVYPGLWNQYFKGAIKDVQFWSRALSEEEIGQKMTVPLDSLNEQGLAAYWRLTEGSGNIAHDFSGNNNHGTIKNGIWNSSETSLKAIINLDHTDWQDTDYNGFESGIVDASKSIGSITSYIWMVNGDTISTTVSPTIEIASGTSIVKLTVSDGTYTSSDSVYINVYCGQLITKGRIYSAPTQFNNSFLISSYYDKVYKFDSTGSSNWSYFTGGNILSTIAVGDENNIFVTSTDTRLYSFKNSGIPNWDKAMGGVIASSPAVSTKYNKIYVGLNSGRLFSISYKGDVDWSYQAQGAILASPVIGNDEVIYFGCEDKNVYAIDKQGNFLWKYTAGDVILSSPAVGSDSSVIVNVNDGYLYKISNGELVWKYLFSEHVSYSLINASPVIDHLGNIYIGSLNGCFYSISKDGELNWKYETNSEIHSTASISPDGKLVYFGNDWGHIYALTTAGELKWKLQTNEPPVAAPTLVTSNNIVYAGTVDGKVYIIKDIPDDESVLLPEMQWPTYQGNNQRTGDRNTVITSVNAPESLPTGYSLQNYPNPFNPSTKIQYSLASESNVQIRIFNSLGQVIESFEPEAKPAGYYYFEWNASASSSGIYFCTVTAVPTDGGQTVNKTIKMVLLK